MPKHTDLACVIWDWNGTLLNDAEYGLSVRNRVFPRFGLKGIDTLSEYREQFTFPVRVYYERGGVTERNFVQVADAWMEEYERGFGDVTLWHDAVETLERFRSAGVRQTLLSASERTRLTEQVSRFPIARYFDSLNGLTHIYATSKEALGREYLKKRGIAPGSAVMIGDTLHDAEVARAVGCKCVLVSRGHQNPETLLTAGVPVADTLVAAADMLL